MRVTVAALVLALVVPSVARGVGVNDLAVTALRVPRSVRLTDTRPTRSGRGGVTIENRGTGVVLIPDAATLASLVTIAATASAGPVVCPALAPQVVVRPRQRFPVALVPGHHIQLPLAFPFVCASDPAGASTWDFTATVDRTVIDGMADEDPADDVCPRAPLGTVGAVVDRGCGALALHGS